MYRQPGLLYIRRVTLHTGDFCMFLASNSGKKTSGNFGDWPDELGRVDTTRLGKFWGENAVE